MAELWGGPEDGSEVWMPPGELPAMVGVHRTAWDHTLVVIRGRAVELAAAGALPHVLVYELHTGGPVLGLERPPDRPVYLWAQLLIRQ